MGNSPSIEVADQYENCNVPLGHGTYGYVEKWKHKTTKKIVAVKTIDISRIKKEHREREIKVWQQIKPHANIVLLLDHWMINENIRAVMPLARCNLSKYVEERGREMEEKGTLVDSNILVDMSLMLLEGTSHLHNSTPPIIHRDLKPGNILCFEGENGRIILKIADFGISKFQEQGESASHTTGQGTPRFQAPEIIKGEKYSLAVDVWSLGVVLFYLTTGGEYPYFTEIEDWHQHQQPIDYEDLWKFSNSFFQMTDRILEGIQDIINQMIVHEKRTRISIEVARRRCFQHSVIVLSSRGPSAKRQGDCLGVYEYLQHYNNSPAYRQRHTVAGTPYFLFRDDHGDWCVGEELDGSSRYLWNKTSSDTVPTNNWLCNDYADYGEWKSDPSLTVTTSHPPVCGVIRISLHGAAAIAQADAGGEYRATGDWRAGRPVFSNGLIYLSVRPGWSDWDFTGSHDSYGARLASGFVTWCPASPKAPVSHRFSWSSWFKDNQVLHDGDIRITCDTHQH